MILPSQSREEFIQDMIIEIKQKYLYHCQHKVRPKAYKVVTLARTAVSEILALKQKADQEGLECPNPRIVTTWIDRSEEVLSLKSISEKNRHAQLLYMVPFIAKEVSNIIFLLTMLRDYVEAPQGVSVIELELFVFEFNEELENSAILFVY